MIDAGKRLAESGTSSQHCWRIGISTQSSVDLREGGTFSSRMKAKDGSMGFDFEGVFTKVVEKKLLQYEVSYGRKVLVQFEQNGGDVTVTETFEAETENDPEMRRQGWQSILNNFAQYVEKENL